MHSKEVKIYKNPSFVSIMKATNSKLESKALGLQKYQCITPEVPSFLPVSKILLNEENDDNTETIVT